MAIHLRRIIPSVVTLILTVLAVLAPGAVAHAADGDVAWSVTPCDAEGALDGRTRLSSQLDPGGTTTEHVLIVNASSTDQTFRVYGADAFNTPTGGYDLLTAEKTSVDAGAWVSVDQAELTIPATKQAVVTVTVAAPESASPGDHAAGVVVSLAHPTTDASGVTIDTRVAVRLSVRISGELTPELSVQNVRVGYSPSPVPFGPSNADITYTVKNTGNVTVLGEPRLRVTGPFGMALASKEPEATQEVLPGQSFTVHSVLAGVEPALINTAVVDVKMTAAPGPETTIPGVSSSGRRIFFAMPWTGLLLIAVLGLFGWGYIRRRRAIQVEGEAMWAELVDHAKAGQLPEDGTSGRANPGLLLAVAGSGIGFAVALVAAAGPATGAQPTGHATISLSVPAAATTSPAATQSTQTTGTTTTTTTVTGSGRSTRQNSTGSVSDGEESVESEVLATDPTPTATPTPTGVAAPSGLTADTVWRTPAGLTPPQWGLVGVSGAVLLTLGGLGIRAFLLARANQ